MNDIKSTLSHDKASNRVYLMHLHAEDFPHIITHLDALADEHEYSKVLLKFRSPILPPLFLKVILLKLLFQTF